MTGRRLTIGGGRRGHPGLVVHRDRLAAGEIRTCHGVHVTTPVRTAWDLARRGDLLDAVDALARVGRFHPDLLLDFRTHCPRARGAAAVPDVLALADRRSGSPMETRLRRLLIHAGLPRPQVHDGAEHTRPERVLRDIRRGTRLVARG